MGDPINVVDKSGTSATSAGIWTIVSTLLLITGMILGGIEFDLNIAIQNTMREIGQLKSMLRASGAEAPDILARVFDSSSLDDLEARLERQRVSARNAKYGKIGSYVAAALSRVMMIKALLIDVDIAPEGGGGLEIVFSN